MNNKITNWLLCKLDKRKSVKLLSDPVIPRADVLFDRDAIKVGIPEKPQAAICRVEHDLIDTVSLVEVSDMISRAGKMLEKYLNSTIRPVEGDAGLSAEGISHGIILENVEMRHRYSGKRCFDWNQGVQNFRGGQSRCGCIGCSSIAWLGLVSINAV